LQKNLLQNSINLINLAKKCEVVPSFLEPFSNFQICSCNAYLYRILANRATGGSILQLQNFENFHLTPPDARQEKGVALLEGWFYWREYGTHFKALETLYNSAFKIFQFPTVKPLIEAHGLLFFNPSAEVGFYFLTQKFRKILNKLHWCANNILKSDRQ
jgi:hypothetical protein